MNGLFDNVVENVNPYSQTQIFPCGTLYKYVNSDILQGVINMTQPLFIAVMDDGAYDELPETMAELQEITKGTDLQTLDSCLAIICIDKQQPDTYWYMWYDIDVSDCSIGRFKSTHSPRYVLSQFKKFVEQLLVETDYKTYYVINGTRIDGWITL